ncbi:transcription factor domain-containing protein [Aspergillus clavatus NRRL 1]|uniref:Fungal specific transcription factor domain protein n=1 Tax=Aspergillus clavatus (strain ATCC 1007 / CBS 513.65 / DSM 816 / NCTC 3887 / NRRL 1 / QM 1276 / 107) TaxID=344612 RepID=A1CAW4_ASPCL|nr:fungal specific transcription factor domain protein [Aspergillus clavatus NRRL 1]EAW12882.1 fungal specific transcription factor domain protein [Aspergillus clavatus NRRL 1]
MYASHVKYPIEPAHADRSSPWSRKRKRITNSVSPPRPSPPPRPAAHPVAHETSYSGRSEYLSGSVPFDETLVHVQSGQDAPDTASDEDTQLFQQQRVYDLPPSSVQSHLIDCFMRYCAPWTPIIEPGWLRTPSPSPLLLQAVLLAGSRVSPTASAAVSSKDFYRKAKLLFFFGGGNDSMVSIVAACLLHWYNPVGPEKVSTDTSGFWIRTAGAMAFQIGLHKEPALNAKDRGLRRRLWWALVVSSALPYCVNFNFSHANSEREKQVRDNIISAGTGRPRTINLHDSDVLPPTLDDFDDQNDDKAQLFLAYTTICRLLGDTVEECLRKTMTGRRRSELETALYRWINQALPRLRRSQPQPQTDAFEVNQLLVVYLAILVILHRSPTPNSVPSAASLVAASSIAGVFADFHARDQLQFLGPIFALYGLTAGLSLLSAYRYPALQATAEAELSTIKLCLQSLSKRWRSAVGPIRALHRLTEQVRRQPVFDGGVPRLGDDLVAFFHGVETRYCRQWEIIQGRDPGGIGSGVAGPAEQTSEVPFDGYMDILDQNWEGSGFDWSGSWLLDI